MIDPNRLRPKISPFDWYRLGSGVLFFVLGGYLIFRYIFTPATKRFVTPLVLGGLIIIYGVFRFWMSFRNFRRMLKNQKDTENKETEQ